MELVEVRISCLQYNHTFQFQYTKTKFNKNNFNFHSNQILWILNYKIRVYLMLSRATFCNPGSVSWTLSTYNSSCCFKAKSSSDCTNFNKNNRICLTQKSLIEIWTLNWVKIRIEGLWTYQIFALDLLFCGSFVFGGAAGAGAVAGAVRFGSHRRRGSVKP